VIDNIGSFGLMPSLQGSISPVDAYSMANSAVPVVKIECGTTEILKVLVNLERWK